MAYLMPQSQPTPESFLQIGQVPCQRRTLVGIRSASKRRQTYEDHDVQADGWTVR